MYVAASTRSGITVYSVPTNLSTPSITKTEVPFPSILAPILIKKLIISSISGSWAALTIVVFPFAKQLAIITFWVPPTLGKSKKIVVPSNSFSALASTKPASWIIVAPKASKPFKCWSIGLLPIEHPPGIATFALPSRANIGPNTKNEARILLTNSNEASVNNGFLASISKVFSSGL